MRIDEYDHGAPTRGPRPGELGRGDGARAGHRLVEPEPVADDDESGVDGGAELADRWPRNALSRSSLIGEVSTLMDRDLLWWRITRPTPHLRGGAWPPRLDTGHVRAGAHPNSPAGSGCDGRGVAGPPGSSCGRPWNPSTGSAPTPGRSGPGRSCRRPGRRVPARRLDPPAADAAGAPHAIFLAAGRTTWETAARLYLSPKTVEHHLRGVYGKLGVRSREERRRALDETRGERAPGS